MNEITCPNCHKVFSLDDAGFAAILNQVRTAEFDEELHRRLEEAEKVKKTEIELAEAKTAERLQGEAEKLRTELASLTAKLEAAETEKKLALQVALSEVTKERDSLSKDIEFKEKEKELALANLTDKFKNELKAKDDEVAFYKDFKAKLSTKGIGESLELHCADQFNSVRAGAFPNAEFEKDNIAVEGTKGDYIFRDFTLAGTEILSIMFEMKHEMDEGVAKKQTNESFLAKLDKDRERKGCEYAVLVSTLEQDSILYNSGIVDMSHKYPKMYVVRPQFFIPIITLLRNSALNSVDYKAELEEMKRQQIDVVNFEAKLGEYKNYVTGKYDDASKKFHTAIESIDKAIKNLEDTKSRLLGSENDLRLASERGDKITIRALTSKNPTMKAKFDDLTSNGGGEIES